MAKNDFLTLDFTIDQDVSTAANAGRPERIKESFRAWTGRSNPYAYLTEPLGIDVSGYQGIIDYTKPAPRGVRYISIRGGISYAFKDDQFDRNWNLAKGAGLLRRAYFVFYPDQDPKRQVDNWVSILDGDLGEIPPALDLELSRGMSKDLISQRANQAMDLLSTAWGYTATVYSAAWFINSYVGPRPWFKNFTWWLAGYLYANPLTGFAQEHQGPVPLPTGVDLSWVIEHQTAGKYDATGFGVQSKMIDTDRWLRGLADLMRWSKTDPEPESMTVEEKLADHETRIRALETRV